MALKDNLISYHKFDESGTVSCVDSHGSNITFDKGGGATATSGKINNGVVFDTAGGTDFLRASQYPERTGSWSPGNNYFGVSCWVRMDATGVANQAIVSKYSAAGTQREWWLYWAGTSGEFAFGAFTTGSSSPNFNVYTNSSPATGVLHHVVAVHDPDADELKIKVNDGSWNTLAHTGGIWQSNGEIRAGSIATGQFAANMTLDELAVWISGVPSDAEFTEINNGGSGLSYDEWDASAASSGEFDASGSNVLYVGRTTTSTLVTQDGRNNEAWFKIQGTGLRLKYRAGGTTPFWISVDGGDFTLASGFSNAHASITRLSDNILPTGLTGDVHNIRLRLHTSYSGNASIQASSGIVVLSTGTPLLSTHDGYGGYEQVLGSFANTYWDNNLGNENQDSNYTNPIFPRSQNSGTQSAARNGYVNFIVDADTTECYIMTRSANQQFGVWVDGILHETHEIANNASFSIQTYGPFAIPGSGSQRNVKFSDLESYDGFVINGTFPSVAVEQPTGIIVWLGDSVTAGDSSPTQSDSSTSWDMLSHTVIGNHKTYNRGTSGLTTSGVLADGRVATDIVPENPDYVIVHLGYNDVFVPTGTRLDNNITLYNELLSGVPGEIYVVPPITNFGSLYADVATEIGLAISGIADSRLILYPSNDFNSEDRDGLHPIFAGRGQACGNNIASVRVSGQPSDGDTITIDGITFEFDNDATTTGDVAVTIGADTNATVSGLCTAVTGYFTSTNKLLAQGLLPEAGADNQQGAILQNVTSISSSGATLFTYGPESDGFMTLVNSLVGSGGAGSGSLPTLSSATINTAGTGMVIAFSEAVSGTSGWIFRSFGGWRDLQYVAGDGTATHTFSIYPSVLQNETCRLGYGESIAVGHSGTVQNLSGSGLADIPFFTVTNNSTDTVTRPANPDYLGMPKISGLTEITPRITCFISSGTTPFGFHVSAEQTTVNDGTIAYGDEPCAPFRHLHFDWDFGDPSGTENFTDLYSDTVLNRNTDQKGPKAFYLYRGSGEYTITLNASGINEYGQVISASTNTIYRPGMYEVFLADATTGNYELHVDGQFNSFNIADRVDAVNSGLESLSTVGTGNVRPVYSYQGSNGSGRFEFVGDLLGQSISFTINGSGLNATGQVAEAPQIIEMFAPWSGNTVSVSDLSSWSAAYFDSTAASGGDGSSGTPYNTYAQLETFIDTNYDTTTHNKVAYLKAGSDFTVTPVINWGRGLSGRKILAYGSGNKPILRSSGNNVDIISNEYSYTDWTTSQRLKDYAVVGCHLISTAYTGHAIEVQRSNNGNANTPRGLMSEWVVADCTFEKPSGSSSLFRVVVGGDYNCMGVTSYNNTYNSYAQATLAHLNPNVAEWVTIAEDVLSGGGSDETFDHHIYAKTYREILFQNIKFGPAEHPVELTNFNINYNTGDSNKDEGFSEHIVFDGCDLGGSTNCVDVSNLNNDVSPYARNVVFQKCLIHSNRQSLDSGQENGYFAASDNTVAFKHCDFWDNIDLGVGGNSGIKQFEIWYCNLYSHGGEGINLTTPNAGYVFGNNVHSTATVSNKGALRVGTTTMPNLSNWEIDYNVIYAPSGGPLIRNTEGADIAFTGWQTTYGHDPSGSNTDPGFVDPDHGIMIYNWSTPAYDPIGSGDTTPPTFQSAAINASGSEISITFSESTIGQSGFYISSDITSRAVISLTAVSGDSTATHYHSLSRTVGNDETITVSYNATSGTSQDASGNLLASFFNSGVTNNSTQDIVDPTFQSASINTSGNRLSIVFSENITGQTGFTLTASSGAITPSPISGDGTSTHVHSLSRVIGSGEVVTVSYNAAAGTSQDDAGNLLATFSNSGVTNNSTQDIQDPAVSSASVNSAGTTLTINFHEACSGSTGFSLSATDGDPSLSGVTNTGVAHTYTIGRTIGSHETLTLDYTPGTVVDYNSNALAAFADFGVTNNSTQDTVPPTVSSGTINSSGNRLSIYFDEACTGVGGFTLNTTGSNPSLSGITNTGTVHLYGLSRTIGSTETATLAYTPGVVADLSANALQAFSGTSITNFSTQDITPPSVSLAALNASGDVLTLTFTEPTFGSSGYVITASSGAVNLTFASGVGSGTHYFDLDRVIDGSETATLAYSPGDVVDGEGNAMVAFSGLSISSNGIYQINAPPFVTITNNGIVNGGIVVYIGGGQVQTIAPDVNQTNELLSNSGTLYDEFIVRRYYNT